MLESALVIAGAAGLGTCLGGIAAYLAIRIDLLGMVRRFEDHRANVEQKFRDLDHWIVGRFAVSEQSVHRAHERIDELHDRLSLPRDRPAPQEAPRRL